MSTSIKGPLVHGTRSTNEGYVYRTGMGMMPSAEFVVFHDDFIFPLGQAMDRDANATFEWEPNVPRNWDAAIIDSGATVTTYTTATVGANGVLQVSDATASEGAAVYGAKSIQLISGKRMFIECRVRTDDVTDNAVQFGLTALNAVTNPEDLWTTASTDLVAFGILDGSAYPTMLSDASNGGTSAQAQTSKILTVNTWHTLGIYYDGTKIHGFVDGDLALTWSSASTTIPTATALAPFFGHINGNGAGGNVVLFDYFRIVAER